MCVFFFSSRRRHTRFDCDWSSDVCSSDCLSNKEKKESEQPPEWPDRVERVKTIPADEGMNRFAWDLRYDDPIQIPGAFYSGTGPKGPLALPGNYQVKLTVGGKSQTAPLDRKSTRLNSSHSQS